MKKRIAFLTALVLALSMTAAFAAEEPTVYLTKDQLNSEITYPDAPSYKVSLADDVLTLKGSKVTDEDYDYVWGTLYEDEGAIYFDMSYDEKSASWVSSPISDQGLTEKDVKVSQITFSFETYEDGSGSVVRAKNGKYVNAYGYDNDADWMIDSNKTLDYYDYAQDVNARYDRAGNLVSYSVWPEKADESGNVLSKVTYSKSGNVKDAWVMSADGVYYHYTNKGWEVEQSDEEGNVTYKKVKSGPSGFDMKSAKQYTIPVTLPKTQWYPNNTVGVKGFSLRELYPNLTSKWYNVVPVDLTQEGVQTFDLVASNMYIIGKAYAEVRDGKVTLSYAYIGSDRAQALGETVALFTSLDQLTHDYLEEPTSNVSFNQPISIEEDLGGADVALLLICNRLTYSQPYTDKGYMLTRYWPNHHNYVEYRAGLQSLFDAVPEKADAE